MSIGAVLRSILPRSAPRRCSRGFSLPEICLCLGAAGLLSGIGASTLAVPNQGLTAIKQDLEGALHQAFIQARAQGQDVQVALGAKGSASNVLPVALPRGIQWGKPSGVPLPPGMDAPKVAGSTGEAHPLITITPRSTATATAWFLNDGKDVLCVRLSGQGQVHMLRWRSDKKKWGRA